MAQGKPTQVKPAGVKAAGVKAAKVKAEGATPGATPAGDAPAQGITATATSNQKTEKVGEVVSTKMQKTIIVQVSRRVPHPLYRRIITKHKKFYAHDEANTARVGDVVRIVECRPLSKLKRWQLADIVRRSALVGAVAPAALDKV